MWICCGEIGAANSVSVNITITTLDRELARLLEPRAPRPDLRLQAVRTLAEAGIRVGVFPNPILPLITDSELRLDQLARAARDHGASYFGGGLLFLMPAARRVFFPFLAERFPHLLQRVRGALYAERLFARRVRGHRFASGCAPSGSVMGWRTVRWNMRRPMRKGRNRLCLRFGDAQGLRFADAEGGVSRNARAWSQMVSRTSSNS